MGTLMVIRAITSKKVPRMLIMSRIRNMVPQGARGSSKPKDFSEMAMPLVITALELSSILALSPGF
jgi:hypothetical protein